MLLFLLLTLLSVTLSLSLYGIRVRWSYVRWSIPGCDRCTHGDDKLRRVEQIYTVSASALNILFCNMKLFLARPQPTCEQRFPRYNPRASAWKMAGQFHFLNGNNRFAITIIAYSGVYSFYQTTSTSMLEATSTNLCWRAPFRCPHSDASCNDQTGRTTTGSAKIWFGRLFFSHLSLASSSRLHGV